MFVLTSLVHVYKSPAVYARDETSPGKSLGFERSSQERSSLSLYSYRCGLNAPLARCGSGISTSLVCWIIAGNWIRVRLE